MPELSVSCIFNKLFLIVLLCGVLGCQTLPEPSPIEKDGKIYGITEGSFRNRWWNYYERGLSFADGNFWNEAKRDLRRAIAQRDEDQWRARTYGFHFVDYFPHREMGIIYYHQGSLDEAIDELTISLGTVKTAKAELYLDRARKAHIQKNQMDTGPPEVDIQSIKHLFQTNALTIHIQGIARDDTFVRTIRVGNRDVRIDVSSPQIHFSEDVPLVAGRNSIPIVVTDLMGNSIRTQLTIDVDRVGPIIQIDEPAEGHFASGKTVLVKGYTYDEGGLAELTINGRQILANGQVELKIDHVVALEPKDSHIVVQAKDLAGNVTTAKIASSTMVSVSPEGSIPVDQPDHNPPILEIRKIEKEYRTYLRQAFIEGNIRDDREVAHLYIDGKQILNKPGRNIHFSHLVGLREGVNRITVQGIDASGNEETVEIKITQAVLTIQEIGSRLRVAVNPFQRKTIGDDRQVSYGLEDLLTGAMIDRARFSAIERQHLESILMELKLSQSGLVDENTALKVGRILAADCMLFGHVLERAGSVEAYIRIVDCETAQILAAIDGYGEDVNLAALRMLGQRMELKLAQELPLVEGMVVSNDGSRIIVDLGKDSRIKSGMKLIVYEIVESIKQSNYDMEQTIGYRELGQARMQAIMEQTSSAEMMDDSTIGPIQAHHFVVTR